MQTAEFEMGLEELCQLAAGQTVAIMCAEAVPWRCHRSLVADALIAQGVQVRDIMSIQTRRHLAAREVATLHAAIRTVVGGAVEDGGPASLSTSTTFEAAAPTSRRLGCSGAPASPAKCAPHPSNVSRSPAAVPTFARTVSGGGSGPGGCLVEGVVPSVPGDVRVLRLTTA